MSTHTFSSKTASSQEGLTNTHSDDFPPSQHQDIRIHGSFLFPTIKKAGETSQVQFFQTQALPKSI